MGFFFSHLLDNGKEKKNVFTFVGKIPNKSYSVALISRKPEADWNIPCFLLHPSKMQMRLSNPTRERTQIQVQSIPPLTFTLSIKCPLYFVLHHFTFPHFLWHNAKGYVLYLKDSHNCKEFSSICCPTVCHLFYYSLLSAFPSNDRGLIPTKTALPCQTALTRFSPCWTFSEQHSSLSPMLSGATG